VTRSRRSGRLWIGAVVALLSLGLVAGELTPAVARRSSFKLTFGYRNHARHGLYVINADGSGERKISSRNAYYPAWSPDGTRIAFASNRHQGIFNIFTVTPRGAGLRRITHGASCFGDSYPDWSPHSQHVVFQRDQCDPVEVWSTTRQGHEQTLLSGTTDYETIVGGAPDWSPDGERIAFHGVDGDEHLQVRVMNRDGSNKVVLTSQPAGPDAQFPESLDPSWSQGSSKIVYTKVLAGHSRWDPTESDVCLVTMVPGSEMCLTDAAGVDEDAGYSPDGDRIVFVSNREGNRNIYVMDSNGLNEKLITRKVGPDYSPQWSPDGRWIAFLSRRHGQVDLYRIHPDGSGLRRITVSKGVEMDPVWRPF
jgi:TolB protein